MFCSPLRPSIIAFVYLLLHKAHWAYSYSERVISYSSDFISQSEKLSGLFLGRIHPHKLLERAGFQRSDCKVFLPSYTPVSIIEGKVSVGNDGPVLRTGNGVSQFIRQTDVIGSYLIHSHTFGYGSAVNEVRSEKNRPSKQVSQPEFFSAGIDSSVQTYSSLSCRSSVILLRFCNFEVIIYSSA